MSREEEPTVLKWLKAILRFVLVGSFRSRRSLDWGSSKFSGILQDFLFGHFLRYYGAGSFKGATRRIECGTLMDLRISLRDFLFDLKDLVKIPSGFFWYFKGIKERLKQWINPGFEQDFGINPVKGLIRVCGGNQTFYYSFQDSFRIRTGYEMTWKMSRYCEGSFRIERFHS